MNDSEHEIESTTAGLTPNKSSWGLALALLLLLSVIVLALHYFLQGLHLAKEHAALQTAFADRTVLEISKDEDLLRIIKNRSKEASSIITYILLLEETPLEQCLVALKSSPELEDIPHRSDSIQELSLAVNRIQKGNKTQLGITGTSTKLSKGELEEVTSQERQKLIKAETVRLRALLHSNPPETVALAYSTLKPLAESVGLETPPLPERVQ